MGRLIYSEIVRGETRQRHKHEYHLEMAFRHIREIERDEDAIQTLIIPDRRRRGFMRCFN